MRKITALLLALVMLGVLSSVASAANGTIWPSTRAASAGLRVR